MSTQPTVLLLGGREGEVSAYALHEDLVNGLFTPGSTNMANVANFMCDLVTNPKTWADWKSKMPVIVSAANVTMAKPTRDAPSARRPDTRANTAVP